MSSNLLNLAGLFVSIVGILITIATSPWFAKKQTFRKSLIYEDALNVGIDAQGKVIPDMAKWFDRRRHRLVIIGIKNDGTETILPSDYVREMRFCFGDGAIIRSARVIQASPPNIHPTLIINEECLIINPTLLNSGDAFVIQVVVRAYGGFKADFRITGTQVCEYQERQPIFSKARFVLSFYFAVYCSTFIVLHWRHEPLASAYATLAAIGGLSLLSVGYLFYFRRWQRRAILRWEGIGKDVDGPVKIG
jgi:multidrug transporter EmrE-like cation transporter